MFLLKFCETLEYSPRIIEHWLHTIQKSRAPKEISLISQNGKVQIFSSEDLSSFLPGCRIMQTPQTKKNEAPPQLQTKKSQYFVCQRKGVLLPIKRFTQFEDRTQKTHLSPLDQLIHEMAKTDGASVKFTFTPINEKKRENAIKKAKKSYFEPERKFDQWETYGWFSIKLRTLFGPIIRFILGQPSISAKIKSQEEQTESLHEREDPRRAILDKLSRPLFKVKITLSHKFSNFWSGFTLPYLGELGVTKKQSHMILSAEEFASILSPPNAKICTATLETEKCAYFPPPIKNPLDISEEDRKRHIYIVGKTGMGKSTALLKLFKEDIDKNRAVVILDPHGDLIEDAIKLIPKNKEKDVIILDPAATTSPIALNPLELLDGENPGLKASALLEMFKVLADGSWGPRLEYILRNTLLALILAKNTTLLDVPRFLTDSKVCKEFLTRVDDAEINRFFKKEFLSQDPKTRLEHTASILNKVGPLLSTPLLRNIFGQPKNKFNLEKAIENQKIVLVPLSKGKLGEDTARFLGMIIISMIQSILLRRAVLPADQRKIVTLFIDEFHAFTTKTLLSMLSESRKYGLALTIANQYLTQLPPEISDSILGNAGSLLIFQVCHKDAEILAPQLNLLEEDLMNLQPFEAYAKFLYKSSQLPLFTLHVDKITEDIPADPGHIKARSLQQVGRNRNYVEEKIKKRYNDKC